MFVKYNTIALLKANFKSYLLFDSHFDASQILIAALWGKIKKKIRHLPIFWKVSNYDFRVFFSNSRRKNRLLSQISSHLVLQNEAPVVSTQGEGAAGIIQIALTSANNSNNNNIALNEEPSTSHKAFCDFMAV